MYSHDLEVVSLNPGRVALGVHSTYVLSGTGTKLSVASASVYLRACTFEITSDLEDNLENLKKSLVRAGVSVT